MFDKLQPWSETCLRGLMSTWVVKMCVLDPECTWVVCNIWIYVPFMGFRNKACFSALLEKGGRTSRCTYLLLYNCCNEEDHTQIIITNDLYLPPLQMPIKSRVLCRLTQRSTTYTCAASNIRKSFVKKASFADYFRSNFQLNWTCWILKLIKIDLGELYPNSISEQS